MISVEHGSVLFLLQHDQGQIVIDLVFPNKPGDVINHGLLDLLSRLVPVLADDLTPPLDPVQFSFRFFRFGDSIGV